MMDDDMMTDDEINQVMLELAECELLEARDAAILGHSNEDRQGNIIRALDIIGGLIRPPIPPQGPPDPRVPF
jgi:hypothetical protein